MASPQVFSPGEDDVRAVAVSGDTLAILNRSEIEQQVEIARKYRRTIKSFRDTLEQYVTIDESVALSMFYSLERRKADGTKNTIVGPSIRFAEALVPCWTNCRAGVRILGEQGNVIAAQGVFFDCETNTGVSVESNRSIVGSKGNRYSADMIVTTGNAVASIAYRNAVVRAVPRALWLDIYEKAKLTAVGDVKSFAAQVKRAVEEFAHQGVTEIALLNTLGAPSLRDITTEHILAMRTMFREIKAGDKNIEDIFSSPEDNEIDALMVELGWNATKQRMSREAFKGKRSDHLTHVRAEAKKMGAISQATPAATTSQAVVEPPAEPVPAPVAEPEPPPVKKERDTKPATKSMVDDIWNQ